MQVVRIRHVRMGMPGRCVVVPVAVYCAWNVVMAVQVVAIVMRVRMFVFQRIVLVGMSVRLRQVQHHAHQHQYPAHRHHPGG